MIRTTVDGLECFLLTAEPSDGGGAVEGSYSLLQARHESRTRREERWGLSLTLRTALRWRVLLERAEANAFRAGLRSLGKTAAGAAAPLQPILSPWWPGVRLWSAAAGPYDGSGLRIVWEPGWGAWQIFTGAAPGGYTTTAQTRTAPLLWGRFDRLPAPGAHTPEGMRAQLSFRDSGPAAYALAVSIALPPGPTHHAQSWPLLTAHAQPGTEAGGVEIRIDRKAVGHGRAEVETHFPQTPRRTVQAELLLAGDDVARLLALWLDRLGPVRPWWIPGGTAPVRLAAGVAAGATTITVDDAAALDGHAHLALDGGAGPVVGRRITGTAGDVLTLDAAPGELPAHTTLVAPLLFVRFAQDVLTLQHLTPDLARATVDVVELPPEYGSPAGEVLGTTLGALGTLGWLYHITDGTSTWRATGHEADVAWSAQTWTARRIEHGRISERFLEDGGGVSLELEAWDGHPFARHRSGRLAAPLTVTIYEARLPGPSAVAQLYQGGVRRVSWDGQMVRVEVGGLVRRFEQRFPRPLVQRRCNAVLFDSRCGLVRADWTFSARLADAGTPGDPFAYVFDTLSWRSGAALPAIPAHFFAFGYAERTLGDGTKQVLNIVDSTALSSGAVTLILDGDLDPWPAGVETAWTIVPGCDGRWETCRDVFANTDRFRGFPHTPKTNPTITKITPSTPAGGKK